MRIALAVAISLILAVTGAAVVWLWWRSPVPTFHVLTAVLHGMLLGVGLMWVVLRLKIRPRALRMVVGFLTGSASVLALAAGQYMDDAYAYHHDKQRAIAAFARLPRDVASVLHAYDHGLLIPATGQRGIIGHLSLQHRRAWWRPWVHRMEALLVIGIPIALAACAVRPDSTAEVH